MHQLSIPQLNGGETVILASHLLASAAPRPRLIARRAPGAQASRILLGVVVLAAIGGGIDARQPIEKGYELLELTLVVWTAEELANLPDVGL